eukprot:2406433-Amphidinium_carterae.2
MAWRASLEQAANASDEILLQDSTLKKAACTEAAFTSFDVDTAAGSEAKTLQEWIESHVKEPIETLLLPAMSSLRTRVSGIHCTKVRSTLTSCKPLQRGKPDGGNWQDDINGSGLDAMKHAAEHMCRIDFATSLRDGLNELVKDTVLSQVQLAHIQQTEVALVMIGGSRKLLLWCFLQRSKTL